MDPAAFDPDPLDPDPFHPDPFDPAAVAAQLDQKLRAAGSPERAEREAAYLRSDRVHYGTPVPAVRAAVRQALRASPRLGHDALVRLVLELWDEPSDAPVHERCLAAALVLVERRDVTGLGDVTLWERLIREARTWALVDVLAGDAAGPALEREPDRQGVTTALDQWAGDADFWVRRAALLTHLRPLRAGAGDWERFTRYAGAMLGEREFFIRKAIGWVLRDTSRRRPDLVFDWLLPRAQEASGVTFREAVKYLTPAQRERVLSRRRDCG